MPVLEPARARALFIASIAMLSLSCLCAGAGAAPVKVWVALADKGPGCAPPAPDASPESARAYENRALYPPYLKALADAGFSREAVLKWQNRVSGRIEPARLAGLRALPFVASVAPMPRRRAHASDPVPVFPAGGAAPWAPAKRAAGSDYGAAAELFDSLGVSRVQAWLDGGGSAPGQGVRVAIIDADFHLGSALFASMKGRIRDQWDFPAGTPQAADDQLRDSHGAECLSLIGGNVPGTLVGAAPAAEFLLYRAEVDESETYAEEDFVAAAIERAVDSGAHVISISLGYRYDFDGGAPDIPFAAMDGRTRPASLAALGAARRGALVAVSMGNEADSHPGEPSLGSPADADSILAVGIADRARRRCSYSSTGPAADGRVKPEVATLGLVGSCAVTVANPESAAPAVVSYSGTSFAAPVAAAVAALLRQARPEAPAEEIRRALMLSADRADAPDSGLGYGVLDAAAALRRLGVDIGEGIAIRGRGRLIHVEGGKPIVMAVDPLSPSAIPDLVDLSGRKVPITMSRSGRILHLRPDRRVPTGIYIAHIP